MLYGGHGAKSSSRAAECEFACRQYKKDLLDHVSTFLAAVKASLVKLGVDKNRLHRIVAEVSIPALYSCILPLRLKPC